MKVIQKAGFSHCTENILNICIQIEPVTGGALATVRCQYSICLIVAAVWGQNLKNRMNSSFSSNNPSAINPVLHIILVQNS